MAIAAEELAAPELTPEVAAEHQALVERGAAPGRSTLQQARRNVAARQASAIPASAAAPAPRPPRSRSAPQGGPNVGRLARGAVRAVSTPSATAQTLTRLIWAIALGLIALQIAAEATGQRWAFNLPGGSGKPAKQPYQPLYAGQGTVTAAMPGVLPNTVGNTAPVAGQGPIGLVP